MYYHERDGLFDDVDASPALRDINGVHNLQHGQSAVLTLVQEPHKLVEIHLGRVHLICIGGQYNYSKGFS